MQVIDGQEHDVAISALRLNDLVLVKPGERFPVDGEVVDGQSHADEALINWRKPAGAETTRRQSHRRRHQR